MENEEDLPVTVTAVTTSMIVEPQAQKGAAVTQMTIKAPLPVEKRTVFGPSGKGDLGTITDEMAEKIECKAGVVRLLNGVEGRNSGYGLKHIEAKESRGKQIAGLGYRNVFAYVSDIAGGFDAIALQDDGRLVLIKRNGPYSHQCVCQWDEDLEIWSVTTSIPMRRERDLKIVWGAEWN